MTELFLLCAQATAAVEEVDCVAVAEQMSVDIPLKPRAVRGLLDNLVCPLLGDVTALAGREQVVASP